MIAAAHIGYTFHIDPVAVLNSDWFDWSVRVAAMSVIADALERQKQEG